MGEGRGGGGGGGRRLSRDIRFAAKTCTVLLCQVIVSSELCDHFQGGAVAVIPLVCCSGQTRNYQTSPCQQLLYSGPSQSCELRVGCMQQPVNECVDKR